MRIIICFLLLTSVAKAQYVGEEDEQLQRLHVQVNFDPYVKHHDYHAACLRSDLGDWHKTINRKWFVTATKNQQQGILAYCDRKNKEVKQLSRWLTVEVTKDSNLPSPAYCVGKYGTWNKFPEGFCAINGVYLQLFQYLHSDYVYDLEVEWFYKHWLQHDINTYWDYHDGQKEFVNRWLEKQNIKDNRFYVYQNNEVRFYRIGGQEVVTDKGTAPVLLYLDEIGYVLPTTVAWGRYPQRSPNPLLNPYYVRSFD